MKVKTILVSQPEPCIKDSDVTRHAPENAGNTPYRLLIPKRDEPSRRTVPET